MNGGTKKTEEKQQQTTTNTLDPVFKGLVMDNYAAAQGRADSLTPYTGPLTAEFTPTQLQAQGLLSSIGTDTSYGRNNQAALDSVRGLLDPGALGNLQIDPALLADADLSAYMNPYTRDVIDTTLADQERARQIAQVSNNQKANAAGAFGGSRSAVLDSLTNEAYDRNTGNLVANLNRDAFTNAQTAAMGDVGIKNNVAQQNIANQLAAAGLRMDAAGNLVALNDAALGTAAKQGGILAQVGDAQQAQEQANLDRIYQNWLQGQNLTIQQQQLLNQALGLVPNQQTVSSSGTSSGTSKESGGLGGLGGILGGVGSLFSGIGAL